jgi:hypothetical protein
MIEVAEDEQIQKWKRLRSFNFGNWIIIWAFLSPVFCLLLFWGFYAGVIQEFWGDANDFLGDAKDFLGDANEYLIRPLLPLMLEILPSLIIWGFLSVWVWIDARNRRINQWVWSIFIFIAGIICFPFYFAKRPLKDGEIREGGFMFNVLKGFVLVWTLTCVVSYGASSVFGGSANSFFAKIGFATLWILPMVGAALLGWFVRNPAIVERGPTGPLAASSNRPAR